MIEASDTKEYCRVSLVEHIPHENDDEDGDEDAYFCEIKANDQRRICKARTAHESVFSEPDSFLVKNHYQIQPLPT